MKSFKVNPREVNVEPYDVDASRVLGGSPTLSNKELWTSSDGREIRGIWQMTPGVVTDIEGDEMFVVLEGRATVELPETGGKFEVGPGDVGILEPGENTKWTVHETVRKVYVLRDVV